MHGTRKGESLYTSCYNTSTASKNGFFEKYCTSDLLF
jgi:hypothetical protein